MDLEGTGWGAGSVFGFLSGGAADEGISVLNSSFLFYLHADRLWFFNGKHRNYRFDSTYFSFVLRRMQSLDS
jgi:hypothetical protein